MRYKANPDAVAIQQAPVLTWHKYIPLSAAAAWATAASTERRFPEYLLIFLNRGFQMDQGRLNWIANFIWGIADDVLRDVYVRGKYRDVILPMVVIRRLDAVLEPTKQAALGMKDKLDKAKIT